MTVIRSINYPHPPRRNKYGAKRTVVDGIGFASKMEAAHYVKLKLLHQAKEVEWFFRQPICDLPGFSYRPDFVVRYFDRRCDCLCHRCQCPCRIEFQDVKGVRTRDYDLKCRAMRAVWGITIVEITHADYSLLPSPR